MRSMIDPKLFQEVWEVITASSPASFGCQNLLSGRPLRGVPFPPDEGLRAPNPKGPLQAGLQPSLLMGIPEAGPFHTSPLLNLRPLGQAPSPHSSYILETGSLIPPPAGLTLHRNPRMPLPLFLKVPQIDFPPNRDHGGSSSPLSVNALSPILPRGPQHNPLPVTVHRDPGRQPCREGTPNTFPPENQGPG